MGMGETRSIAFSREEIETLQSAFEVLVNGEGVYMMIHLPEVVAVHKGLFEKFDTEMKAFWVAEAE